MNRSVLLTLLATMCLAMHAHGSTVRKQTFALNVLGAFIQDGSAQAPYISQKYGKSFGYLHTLPSHRDRSYQPWQGTAAGIDSASLKITIDLGAETGFDLPISFHLMFYTGSDESPVKQFEILQKIPVRTNNDGKFVFIKNSFNAAERAALASGAGTLNGTFYAEVFSSSSFSGKLDAELTITPGPGGALAMTVFAMGGLARRRRAG